MQKNHEKPELIARIPSKLFSPGVLTRGVSMHAVMATVLLSVNDWREGERKNAGFFQIKIRKRDRLQAGNRLRLL